MTGVLDEVANVVRWRQLPDMYSRYGSRGIVLSSFFQGWDQGLEAFGEQGMKKLWSAAFLPFLSRLIGDHDVIRRTSSTQKGERSVSTATQRERLLDVNDLPALARGRAVLSTSELPGTGRTPAPLHPALWQRRRRLKEPLRGVVRGS